MSVKRFSYIAAFTDYGTSSISIYYWRQTDQVFLSIFWTYFVIYLTKGTYSYLISSFLGSSYFFYSFLVYYTFITFFYSLSISSFLPCFPTKFSLCCTIHFVCSSYLSIYLAILSMGCSLSHWKNLRYISCFFQEPSFRIQRDWAKMDLYSPKYSLYPQSWMMEQILLPCLEMNSPQQCQSQSQRRGSVNLDSFYFVFQRRTSSFSNYSPLSRSRFFICCCLAVLMAVVVNVYSSFFSFYGAGYYCVFCLLGLVWLFLSNMNLNHCFSFCMSSSISFLILCICCTMDGSFESQQDLLRKQKPSLTSWLQRLMNWRQACAFLQWAFAVYLSFRASSALCTASSFRLSLVKQEQMLRYSATK